VTNLFIQELLNGIVELAVLALEAIVVPLTSSLFRANDKWFIGSAQQSVRKSNLRGFLESNVFALKECPMAASHQNGQNP
jgi:hypothetical protein